jgi:hypothetical protein
MDSWAESGHDLPFEMPPKLQSMNSDGLPVYGEQIETRSASTRPRTAIRGCFLKRTVKRRKTCDMGRFGCAANAGRVRLSLSGLAKF